MKNKQKAWRLGAAKFNQIKRQTGADMAGSARFAKDLCTALGMALRDPKRHRPA